VTAHMLAVGRADATGVYIRTGDGYQAQAQAQAQELTPLGRDVQAFCEAWQRGEVEPCPVCNRFDCDCDEWGEIMHTSPFDPDRHGDLSDLQSLELPY
jgi:hypothetical protein